MLAEAEDVAIKRVLAWQIAEGMKAEGTTKMAMPLRMKTDRRQLDRLLNPENKSVTLRRAATALGRKLKVVCGDQLKSKRTEILHFPPAFKHFISPIEMKHLWIV